MFSIIFIKSENHTSGGLANGKYVSKKKQEEAIRQPEMDLNEKDVK